MRMLRPYTHPACPVVVRPAHPVVIRRGEAFALLPPTSSPDGSHVPANDDAGGMRCECFAPTPTRHAPSLSARDAPSLSVRDAPSLSARHAPSLSARHAPSSSVGAKHSPSCLQHRHLAGAMFRRTTMPAECDANASPLHPPGGCPIHHPPPIVPAHGARRPSSRPTAPAAHRPGPRRPPPIVPARAARRPLSRPAPPAAHCPGPRRFSGPSAPI
jgi:hypothetical protein